jgi:hypothetical protein
MVKGVPRDPRICLRCKQSYQPASGPQKYCNDCRPEARYAYNKNWRTKYPERRRFLDKRAIAKNPEYYSALKKYSYYNWREKLRSTVFGHYSNGSFKCACCGESEQDFLVIDHINGKGNEHRRATFGKINAGGKTMHRWLVKQGFPPGFQLLCANCNTSRGKHGECIHKRAPLAPQKPIRKNPNDARLTNC